MPIQHKVISL